MTSSLVSASAFTAAGSLLLRLPVAGAAPPPVSGPVPPASPVSAATTPPPSVSPLRLQLVLEVDLIASTTSATVTLAARIPTAVKPAAAVSARPAVQFMAQLPGDGLQVHEVAEAGPGALPGLVLPAACLPEVSHRRQLGVNRSPAKPSVVEVVYPLLCVLLALELDVDVAYQMVSQVVTHIHLLDLSVFVLALHKDVLEEVVVMLLHLLVCHVRQMGSIRCLCRVLRVDVKILKEEGLRKRRLVVNPGTTFAVSAGAHFEEKGTIYFVLLGSKDTRQVLGHDEYSLVHRLL